MHILEVRKRLAWGGASLLVLAALPCFSAQPALQVRFDGRGLESLADHGTVLADVNKHPEDAFHIWHMQMTDLKGAPLTTGQYGWGENNSGKVWDSATHSWTYTFSWGSIRTRFVSNADSLDIEVTETNRAGSGVILNGASIYALGLHFPTLPLGFTNPDNPHLCDGVSGPSVLVADYASGVVALTTQDSRKPIYTGFLPDSKLRSYSVVISSTPPDGLATFQPHHERPVRPGETDQFKVNLKFAAANTAVEALASDTYLNWAKLWPKSLQWKDRRVIGTAYLASSPTGDPKKSGGYPNNPRRYFNTSNTDDFDIRNTAGLRKFQERILNQAKAVVVNLKKMDAQGVITWDIEGEEYPQETSYVCAPDEIAAVSPEMESVVVVPASKYLGMKLDDAYFKTIRDAGFRVGVCVRPQHFFKKKDGSAQQENLRQDQVSDELIRKMKFAHERWGATLFYLDSTVSNDGSVLDASIFQKAALALPDSLLIPEESNTRFYAYTAPFKDFLFHGKTGTDLEARDTYPGAFSAILVNDVDPRKLANAKQKLQDAVARGDVLMIHADYWQANDDTAIEIMQAAHRPR